MAPRLLAAVLSLAVASCAPIEAPSRQPTVPSVGPEDREALIETTGCGHASGRTGSGVAIGDGFVLTVAHLVAQADGTMISVGGDPMEHAIIVAVDLERDLALLRVPIDTMPLVPMGSAVQGTRGLVVGGAHSGTVPFKVKAVVSLTIEEVLGSDRHARLGYQLEAETGDGDSGAGAYDEEQQLIGIVFATGQDRESTWITASAEIQPFVAAHTDDADAIECNSETSRLDM